MEGSPTHSLGLVAIESCMDFRPFFAPEQKLFAVAASPKWRADCGLTGRVVVVASKWECGH